MSRKVERVLIFILGIWQILDGGITIIFYGTGGALFKSDSSISQVLKSNASFTNLSAIFGMLLIIFGIINIIFSKFYLKDSQNISKKIVIWLIFQCIFSYFILDIIGILCSIIGTVVLLARNKAKKKMR